jgi:hypothetical protein
MRRLHGYHMTPIRHTNEVVPLQKRQLELINLVNFLLPWRIQAQCMQPNDLRAAAEMLRVTADRLVEFARHGDMVDSHDEQAAANRRMVGAGVA